MTVQKSRSIRSKVVVTREGVEFRVLLEQLGTWKARAEALEQILLRTLRCEFGSPTGSCPWWAALANKTKLPKLVRVVQRGTPRKGWFFATDWVCEACLKSHSNYKLESDPIGKAGK